MDVVGSEIGQKMRSAIKAKLTELGCYVDDELPDYVMVMVANKRTREQMEDDLQLFLGDNTELFVNWLHQVLKKLQEVTVTAPLKAAEAEKGKERSKSKEKKSKDKKEKSKKGESSKKSKKKSKEKALKKKEEKKLHKSKKKSKHQDIIRPNIPPLLMNMEKNSEPSITDVFAGQILKNHGVLLDSHLDESKSADQKPMQKEKKRAILPIIDPATITSQSPLDLESTITPDSSILPDHSTEEVSSVDEAAKAPREEQIKEINEIEAKIQGLKQKLAEQLDSMSDDEDFLTIRTEAEELMNDFAEDVYQEISQPPPATPPIQARKSPPLPPSTFNLPKETPKDIPETLPQIELNLPKRPIRERLGARKMPEYEPAQEKPEELKRQEKSPERFTPEKEPEIRPNLKSAKSRLGSQPEPQRKPTTTDDSEKSEPSRRLTSRVSVLESRPTRPSCASVVRVRPRPRVGAPAASSLLMRAVADAHKSLLNIPLKADQEPQKVKRALVLPMRRTMEAQKIVISVPRTDTPISVTPADSASDNVSLGELSDPEERSSKRASDNPSKEEYAPMAITKVIHNTDYMPNRTLTRHEDSILVETINIHTTTVDKAKDTQFIVTMDGYHPNAFLAKKLMTEGILNDEEEVGTNSEENTQPVLKSKDKEGTKDNVKVKTESKTTVSSIFSHIQSSSDNVKSKENSSVIEEQEVEQSNAIPSKKPTLEKRKSDVSIELKPKEVKDNPPVKKRKASPIVFDVNKKEKEVDRVRERTLSASSDSHVTITTVTNSHKYDTVPPLSVAERKTVWCRAFPQCRYGSACAFAHPRCKFAAGCTRRGCVYSHAPNALAPLSPLSPPTTHVPQVPQVPVVASHVVPAANYKSISAGAFANLCKYYPSCSNPACHFYHPKPCRYGKACSNKLECNFYHQDVPASKWKYSV